MVKIVISGAEGRMGKRIMELAGNGSAFSVVGGIELRGIPGSNIAADLKDIKQDYDCIIEFTTPQVTIEHVKKANKAMVIGTTGLSAEEIETVKKASRKIPIVFAPNMSVGVNVCFGLIAKAAEILGKDYKPRIMEAHHTHKKDKPSGTAKLMANIISEKTGIEDIPVESIREDEIVGDHEIVFESDVDTVKILHSAKTRDIFALGALKAAQFVVTKKNGLFSMADVLGLRIKD